MKNVGKGTWSQYFGLDNTATKRAAEQDKNALNREVDQQLKAIKRTRENTENTNTSISPTDTEILNPVIPTWLYETDENREKRLKLEDSIKEQTDALADDDYVQNVIN